jgi:hypothetical protein
MREFYDGPIYFIVSDYISPFLNTLISVYKVTIIKYDDVIHKEFNSMLERNYDKFDIATGLKIEHREKLFIYSFERFYILHNFMKF